MVKTPKGYLRRPAVAGFMAPQVVLELVAVIRARLGQPALDALLLEAQLHRLPGVLEPVREDKAQRLHMALKRAHPAEAEMLLREAGQASAESLLRAQQSERAQALLNSSPWPIAAWMLGRWAVQHDWTFAGTGRFRVVNALEYTLADNPLHRGERAGHPTSYWHMALFERLFQRLVDPALECREIACEARGDPACHFVIARA